METAKEESYPHRSQNYRGKKIWGAKQLWHSMFPVNSENSLSSAELDKQLRLLMCVSLDHVNQAQSQIQEAGSTWRDVKQTELHKEHWQPWKHQQRRERIIQCLETMSSEGWKVRKKRFLETLRLLKAFLESNL